MDEVDQLFHEKEMNLTKQILTSAPTDFQLVFYSATADRVTEEARKLAEQLTIIDVTDEDHSAGTVNHYYMNLSSRKKSAYLRSLSYTSDFRGMVFFNQVADLGAVEEKLVYEGLSVVSLASDQNKALRKLAIDQFSNKKAVMLLTTDIAARGLDFEAVPYVINTEVPLSEESYIHRAGRVGRMGVSGTVITFVNDATKRDYQRILKKIGLTTQEIFLYEGALHLTRKEKSLNEERAASSEKIKKVPTEQRKEKVKKRPKNSKNKGARRKTSQDKKE